MPVCGQELDLIHIDEVGADGFRHEDAVAADAGDVRRADVRAEVRPLFAFAELLTKLDVAGEAAADYLSTEDI